MRFDTDGTVLLFTPGIEGFAKKAYEVLLQEIDPSEKKLELHPIHADYFNNNESDIAILANVRGRHAYVFHAFTGRNGEYSPNDGFMNLYLIDDALRRSSVEKITYVLPHIPYQRKDRMDKPRVPISARRTVQMVIDTNYSIPTRIVTFDMHAGQIQGFVSFPLDHLNASPIFVDYLRQLSDPDTFVIVSPDTGGVTRARHMAKKLNNNEIVLVDKRRPAPGEAEVMHIVGEEIVKDRPCVIRDDIADTGGTACKAANALREAGATYIYLCATHGVFSRQKNNGRTAEEEFRKSGIKVITTDTIPRSEDYIEANKDWLTVLSVVPMTAEAIYRIQTRGSLSELIE